MAVLDSLDVDFSESIISALLVEIKDICEKHQSENDVFLSIGAGYKQPIVPHMRFEYPDPEIQQDLYKLMKYSCEEVCTPDQRDKVMKIWTTFLEPVLGVTPRHTKAVAKGDAVKTCNHVAASSSAIDEENSNPVGEAALPAENGDEQKVLTSHGNNGVNNDAPNNGLMQTDTIMMAAMSLTVKQAEEGTSIGAGEKNCTGPEYAGADCGIETMPGQESKDCVIAKPTSSSMGMLPKEVKDQKYHEETDACTKGEREEGELSPNRNLEEIAALGNSATKAEQSPRASDPSTKAVKGEEMCVEEAGVETDANADDEVEESAHGSSESENASENGDVSASESANGEEGSPVEPDDENGVKAEESEGEANDVADVSETEGAMPFSDRVLLSAKPLTLKIPKALQEKETNTRIFYGNDSFYLLFRLHKMLYERMQTAKLHSSSPENKWRMLNDANPTDAYARFKDALHSLLNGSSDSAKFEDECRAIVGAQSYILFTLDKLIHKLVKQLQTIAAEEIDNKLIQLYEYERSRNPKTFSDAVYRLNARFLLPEDNLYRIEYLPSPMSLTLQLMRNDLDKPEPAAVSVDPTFAAYLNDDLLSVQPERYQRPGVFLKRNKIKFSKGDELSDTTEAMEGLIIHNGVEMRLNSQTMKIGYVLDTEDFLYRTRRRRKELYHKKPRNDSSVGTSNGTSDGSSQRVKRRKLILGME